MQELPLQRVNSTFNSRSNSHSASLQEKIGRSIKLALVSIPYGEGPQVMMPLGLMNIAGFVHQQFDAAVTCKIFDFSDADLHDISPLCQIVDWAPDLIGLSIYSSHILTAVEWGRKIRAQLPNALLFCGGPHVTLDPSGFVSDWGDIFHVVVFGEGELPTAQLIAEVSRMDPSIGIESKRLSEAWKRVNNLYWRNAETGTIEKSALVNWQMPPEKWANPLMVDVTSAHNKKLIFTDRRDGSVRKAVALTSSRGCPLNCSFCAIIVADVNGERWRACTPDQLISWLISKYQVEPFEHVYLMDANFFVKPARVLEFSAKLHETFDGKVTWSTSSTVGYLLKIKSHLPVLAEQGLRLVEIGIESGSQKQLKYLNKHVTVDDNVAAVRELHRNSIDIGVDFIMFYPDQSVREIQENLQYFVKARLTQHEVLDQYFNLLILYPGTKAREEIQKSRDIVFDRNIMPESRFLIADAKVAWIYVTYIDEFARVYIPRLNAVIRKLHKITLLFSGDPQKKRRLRLAIVFLRHMPFQALWALTIAKEVTSFEAAFPMVHRYVKLIEEIESSYEITDEISKNQLISNLTRGRSGEVGSANHD
jgi:radical SAM superfamily enzyme YgiQ (UPF0313 family)